MRRVLLVVPLTFLLGCGGLGAPDEPLLSPCEDSEVCGYPDTVFECLPTSQGQVCTRTCQGDIEAGAAAVGDCVPSSTCDSMAEVAGSDAQVCCKVDRVARGDGIHLGKEDRYHGICDFAGSGPRPNPQDVQSTPSSCAYEVMYIVRCSDGTVDNGEWGESCVNGACPEEGSKHNCTGGCCVTTITRNPSARNQTCE